MEWPSGNETKEKKHISPNSSSLKYRGNGRKGSHSFPGLPGNLVQDPKEIWSKYSESVYPEDIFHSVKKPWLQKDTAYRELQGKDCQLRHSPGDWDINGVTATAWNIVNSVKYSVKYYTHYKAVCFKA